MPDISFEFRPATGQEIEFTARQLLEHSRQALNAPVEHQPFALLAYEGEKMVGSLIGKTFFNWLHIDLIWVHDDYRRKGLGTSLIKQAAQKALQMGIDGIEVWTQNWQAPEFYRKLGFEEFAALEDFAPGRKRYAFRYYIKKYERFSTSLPLSEVIREHIKTYFSHHGDTLPPPGVYDRLLPLFEKPLLEVTLEATGGNQLKAAHLLGINRNTLRKKILELGITIQGNKT